MGLECHQSWRFVGRPFQLYDTSPLMMIPNWPWAWPCWNCTTSYKFFVSVKKMGEGWTGGASDIVKAKSSGEDPRATGGLVSNLPHPRVNKTKQHTQTGNLPGAGGFLSINLRCHLQNDYFGRNQSSKPKFVGFFPLQLDLLGKRDPRALERAAENDTAGGIGCTMIYM